MGDLVKQYKGLYPLYDNNSRYIKWDEPQFFFVAGGVRYIDNDFGQISMIKINTENDDKEWGFDHGANTLSVAIDEEQNVFIGGVRNNEINTTMSSLRKLDKNGNLIWSVDTGFDVTYLVVDSDYVYTISNENASNYTVLRVYDKDGTFVTGYSRNHGTNTTTRFVSVNKDGEILLIFSAPFTGATRVRMDLLDNEFNSISTISIPSNQIHEGYFLRDGNVYTTIDRIVRKSIGTSTLNFTDIFSDTALATAIRQGITLDSESNIYYGTFQDIKKRNSAGTLIWQRTGLYRSPNKITITPDDEFIYMTGPATTTFVGGNVTRVYDKDGTLLKSYNLFGTSNLIFDLDIFPLKSDGPWN
jgi:hypothetical protein